MNRRPLPLRFMALVAVALMPWTVAGPGIHDPDCVHHRGEGGGAAHVAGQSAGSHGGGGHASHTAHATASTHHQDGGQDSSSQDSSSEDCTCLGVCVPGGQAGAPVVTASAGPEAPAALPSRTVVVATTPTPRTNPSLRLPPSTGPPAGV